MKHTPVNIVPCLYTGTYKHSLLEAKGEKKFLPTEDIRFFNIELKSNVGYVIFKMIRESN